MKLPIEIADRLRRYNETRGIQAFDHLGDGKDGYVVSIIPKASPMPAAAKIFLSGEVYQRERDTYIRLRDHRVSTIRGLSVPQLINFDDKSAIIEMSLVAPPRILDFASARLDHAEDFGAEILQAYEQEICELFDDRASDVFTILHELQTQFGIYYYDARPSNITF